MYEAIGDPYCYPGTTVLRNKLGIRDQNELEQFETDAAKQRADEPLPVGRFTVRHYYAIHRHLFRDVYSWAGKTRTVRISKQDSMFCYPEHIHREMHNLFLKLRDARNFEALSPMPYSQGAASFLATLNAIHPFRDGNGRTQLAFLKLLTLNAGHPFKIERLKPDEVLKAMICSFSGDERPLIDQILRIVE
jgi:cell filamentation protein